MSLPGRVARPGLAETDGGASGCRALAAGSVQRVRYPASVAAMMAAIRLLAGRVRVEAAIRAAGPRRDR